METITQVDVLVVVLDASMRTGRGDRFVLELLDRTTAPVILALNKIDLMAKHRLLPLMDWYRQQRDFAGLVPISALTGDGVPALDDEIRDHLPEGEPLFPDDFVTDQPERVVVAETVREKVLHETRAELPFASAVVVDRFEEPDPRGIMRLYCSIVVDRGTHKPIVLGRGGARIKRIGSEARHELERRFGTRVYLDLHVRVRPGWRENERMLRELGLER